MVDSEIQAAIRSAVSAGQLAHASALWETYASQMVEEIRRGVCSQERLAQMRELIEWTRGVTASERAQARRRLDVRLTGLHVAAAYSRFR
jgi:hypothetical protein